MKPNTKMQDAVMDKVISLIMDIDPNIKFDEYGRKIIRNVRRNGLDINAWSNIGVNDEYIFSKITITELYQNLSRLEVYHHNVPQLTHEHGWEVDLSRKGIK